MVSARLCCAICLVLVLLPLAAVQAEDVGPVEEKWSLPHKSQLKLGRTLDRPRYQSLEQRQASQQLIRSVGAQNNPTPPPTTSAEASEVMPDKREQTPAAAFASRLPGVKPPVNAPVAPQPAFTAQEGLKPGHVLQFVLENDPELSGILTIDQDGFAQIPLVGRLSLAGKTLTEAEAALRAAFANGFFIKPRLMLSLGDGS